MPSKYDPASSLPLRVPPEVRASLDDMGARLPPGLGLPRQSVAVAALRRGLVVLGAELDADPMAVHRALAGTALSSAGQPSRESPAAVPAAQSPAPLDVSTLRRRVGAALEADRSKPRGKRRWTTVAVAAAIGANRKSLTDWLAGEPALGESFQHKLAELLAAGGPAAGGAP